MGAAAIVTTAAGLIYRNWDKINDVLGLTETKFKSTADVIKELEATTRRTTAEFIRLKEARESAERDKTGEAAFKSLPKGTPEDAERGTAFSKAVGEAGGSGPVVDALLKANPELLLRFRPAEDSRKVQGIEADINSPLYRRIAREGARATDAERESLRLLNDQLDAAKREADENTKKYLESRIGIIKESGKREAIEKFAGTLPEALRKPFLEAMEAPEKKKRKEADEKTVKEADEEARLIDEADAANLKKFNEARAKRRKRVDELNRAGAENEAFALRQAQEFAPAVAEAMIAQHQDPAELERARRQRFDQEKAAALKAAGEAIPDLAGQTERRLLHTPGAAKDVDDAAAAQLQAALTAGGLGQDQAALAALLTVRDARKKLQDQATKAKEDPFAMMDLMGEGEPKRKSQTLDALAYARSIQAGVGGEDVGKKQLEKMDKQITTLNQIRQLLANPRQRGVFLPAQ